MSQTQIPFTAATNTAPRAAAAAAAAAELPPVPPVFLPVGDLKGSKLEYSTLVDPTARNAKVACVFCGSSPC